MPSVALATLSSVPFGGVNLQLQSSTSDKDPETLLVEVLTQTVKYLDQSFTHILMGSGIEFSHIGLSVDTFDIASSVNEDSVSFTFSGTAFFESDPPPTQDDVLEILAQSFLGKNSQKFTSTLMQSSSPFLQRLSYAIVQVNGYVIPGNVLQEEPESNPPEESSMNALFIAAIAGSVTAAFLVVLLCYCLCCLRSDTDDSKSSRAQPQNQSKRTISASQTGETDDIEAVSQAPSSPQSIASQDSSVFTYNPTYNTRASFDASTLSTNTTDTNALDLATWQQKNIINNSRFAPFGHDISAIEMLNDNKKDLSLIEEGDESATPVKSMEQYLSKENLSNCERLEKYNWDDQSQSSDVITDLCNLSHQINQYRRR